MSSNPQRIPPSSRRTNSSTHSTPASAPAAREFESIPPPASPEPPKGFAFLFVVAILSVIGLCAYFCLRLIFALVRPASKTQSAKNGESNRTSTSSPGYAPPPPLRPRQERTFNDLTWEEFELLVGEIYRRMGYSVELSAGTGADGGIDLVLTKEQERVLVQCKNWNTSKVSAPAIREFFGVLVSEGATWGIFVTAGTYTRDAREFAQGKPMYLIDGEQLKLLVKQAQNDPGDDLLNVPLWAPVFMACAKVTDPECPFCRAPMAIRNGSRGAFWGCSKYPCCRGKREVRQYLRPARAF